MACGLICVATDNGNAKALINNPSLIVPVKNAKLLADAILYVLNKSTGQRCLLGEKNREQIVTLYSVAEMVVQYEQLYVGLVN